MRGKMSPNAAEIKGLMNVALGNKKADLVIQNGNLINVYTGELLKNWSVAVKGTRIAYTGDDASHTIGPDTKVIDAEGKTLIPGLIDGHTHVAWYFTLYEFLKYAMRGGTTTIITETIEIAFPLGYKGIIEFLESAENQPIKIFATAPPMPNISPAAEACAMDVETLQKLLKRDDVVGLGEMYWSSIIKGNDRICRLFAETLSAGKKIEGHSAGARGRNLAAYMATGVSSCHESTTVEEVVERLRLGIYTMIREGDIRKELQVVSKIKDQDIDFRRLILVTDGIGPENLMKQGNLEYVVQRAINFGFDPVKAVQMATLNVAEHFGLDHIIGGIAPGKCADILIIPDPKTIKAEYVISNGKIIARDGELLVEPKKHDFPGDSFASIRIPRKLRADDFSISAGSEGGTVTIRVMDLITPLVSRESLLDMPVSKGEIKADPKRDLLKIAIMTNSDQGMKKFTGLLKGFGLKKGALATSAVWDSCAILVAGANEEDMAGAVNRVLELKGGVVVFVDGKVRAELPMPIGGVISDLPMENIRRSLRDIQNEMSSLGCSLPDAHLTLTIFSSPAIPFLRISEEGLVDIKKGEIVGLIIPV